MTYQMLCIKFGKTNCDSGMDVEEVDVAGNNVAGVVGIMVE